VHAGCRAPFRVVFEDQRLHDDVLVDAQVRGRSGRAAARFPGIEVRRERTCVLAQRTDGHRDG
jgi:hypothetical protein